MLEEDDNGGAGVDTSDLARDEDDIYPGNNDDLSMTGDANDGSSYSDSPRYPPLTSFDNIFRIVLGNSMPPVVFKSSLDLIESFRSYPVA